MDMIKQALLLEKQIKEATDELYKLYFQFKYKLFTEYQYTDELLDGMQPIGYIDSNDTVIVYNSVNGYHDHCCFYSNSLTDMLIYASKNLCQINDVNDVESEQWPQIASFCRKNVDALHAHPDLEKIESLLATGIRDNLLLVKELIKY